MPRLAGTFALVVAFSLAMMFQLGGTSGWIRWSTGKPWLALAGLACAGLASSSALGLLMYCNLAYIDAMAVVPFLVICGSSQW